MIEKDYRKKKPEYNGIGLYGRVTVTNGDTIIMKEQPNAIVRNGMRHIASTLCGGRITVDDSRYVYFGSYQATIKFGKDESTATIATHDALVSLINVNPTSGVPIGNNFGFSGSGSNRFTEWNATWNSGVLNTYLSGEEKLGEIGLYLNELFDLSAGWVRSIVKDAAYTFPSALFSRISLGESSFVPDPDKPVSVIWRIGVDFS